MEEKIKLNTKDDCNIVKEVWRLMLSVDSMTQQELIEKIQALTGKSNTAGFYILKILCKPIQTNWKMKGDFPEATFVDPLLIEFPSVDRKNHYALYPYWRDYVTSGSDVFDRAKRFY